MPHLNPSHANLNCQRSAPASDCIMFLQATLIKPMLDAGKERGGGQGFGENAHNNLRVLGNMDRRSCTFITCLSLYLRKDVPFNLKQFHLVPN